MSPPDAAALAAALHTLHALGAVDDDAALTAHGRRMAALPLAPVWAHTLLRSADFACESEMLTAAAVLSVESPLLLSSSAAADRSGGGGGGESAASAAAAAAAHALMVRDGDLPTLLRVYDLFWKQRAPGRNKPRKGDVVNFMESTPSSGSSGSSGSSAQRRTRRSGGAGRTSTA